MRDQQAQATAVRALEPAVVLGLVRGALPRVRPVGERRVAVGVVVEVGRRAGDEHGDERVGVQLTQAGERVADDVAAALVLVEALAAGQRVLDAEAVERRAVEDAAAAEAEAGERVRVGLDDAEDVAVGPCPRRDVALGVEGELGELGAARGGVQREDAGLRLVGGEAGRGQEEPVRVPADLQAAGVVAALRQDPLGRRAELVVDEEHVGLQRRGARQPTVLGDEVAPLGVVEEVRAQVRRAQAEPRALVGRGRREGERVTVAGGLEPARVAAARRRPVDHVAAAGELEEVLVRGRRWALDVRIAAAPCDQRGDGQQARTRGVLHRG